MPFSTEMPDEVLSQGYFPSCRHRRDLDGKCQFVPLDQAFLKKKMSFTEHYIYPNNVFYTDFTLKNYFGNVFSAHFPIWGREIEELDRLRLALNIWRHFRKLPSAETRKNFKGVLFSFCGEEKYNTEVAVKSTKTMKNSGHLTFLLTQQVWPEKTADIWRRYKWFPHQKHVWKTSAEITYW